MFFFFIFATQTNKIIAYEIKKAHFDVCIMKYWESVTLLFL